MNNTALVNFTEKYYKYKSVSNSNRVQFYILYLNSKNKTKIYYFSIIKDEKSIKIFIDNILKFEQKYPNKIYSIGISG